MALRIRARLSLTISFLVFLTVAVMIAVGLLFHAPDAVQDGRQIFIPAPLAAAGCFMVILGAWVGLLLSAGIAKPMEDLTRGAREFANGNLNHRTYLDRKDEFYEMGQAFNTMAISLQEYIFELEHETARRERLESEFRIASEMQQALLPEEPPKVDGLDLVGWSCPSREVGGDFYDFIVLEPGRVAVAIGDATGKGLSAALLITQCWSMLRTLANEIHEPGELLYRTNNEFYNRIGATHRFVTLFLIVFDVTKGTATYATAGHPAPMRVSEATGRTEWLPIKPGFPLGIVQGTAYEELEVPLEKGDTFIAFSDGLTDARNHGGEFFGDDGVESFLRTAGNGPVGELLTKLREDAERHMAGAEPIDDMTLVGVRFEGARDGTP